jgi:chaperonin GroES
MGIRPLEDKVILELPTKEEKKTDFGLIIAGTADEKPQEAIVLAVGPGLTFADGSKMTIDLRPGDKVLFSKYQGTEISFEGKDYLVVAYRDILAVMGENNG